MACVSCLTPAWHRSNKASASVDEDLHSIRSAPGPALPLRRQCSVNDAPLSARDSPGGSPGGGGVSSRRLIATGKSSNASARRVPGAYQPPSELATMCGDRCSDSGSLAVRGIAAPSSSGASSYSSGSSRSSASFSSPSGCSSSSSTRGRGPLSSTNAC